jgi:hypothetical protein
MAGSRRSRNFPMAAQFLFVADCAQGALADIERRSAVA